MKRILLVVTAASLLLMTFAQAGLYRWVDEAGEVHFSDKVPAAASRKAVSEMNRHGVVQKTTDPEAEVLARLEYEANLARREEIEAQKRAEQEKLAELQKRDEYLLSTYESKDEITKSFNRKIKLMKGNAAILDAQTQVLEKRLKSVEKQHSAVKNKERKDSLHSKIINITETINQYKKALVQNNKERIALKKKYEDDFNRYIELTQ